jgi:galactokinase
VTAHATSAALRALGGSGAAAFAPGRCTVVGEHVDYADGAVVCMAVQLGVEVAVRVSADGTWRLRSGDRRAERADPEPCGDVGDLPFATALALRAHGVEVPPLEMAVSATLPEGAGLSSSAALCCATAAAILRLLGKRLSAADLCSVALHAERDIAGVPCGPLDQRAVVLSLAGGALVLDCRDGTSSAVPWPQRHVVVACHTGEAHDVGGDGYRSRRAQADAALALLGIASFRDVRGDDVDALMRRDPLLGRRARHIVTETGRAFDCAVALRRGDAAEVGRLMSASHASLRDDHEVSTPALDAVVAAAQRSDGCLGARLVGAGFGGSAIALVHSDHAPACLDAMREAVGAPEGQGAWIVGPSPGLAALAPDVVTP